MAAIMVRLPTAWLLACIEKMSVFPFGWTRYPDRVFTDEIVPVLAVTRPSMADPTGG
jgi:hypothetical protein